MLGVQKFSKIILCTISLFEEWSTQMERAVFNVGKVDNRRGRNRRGYHRRGRTLGWVEPGKYKRNVVRCVNAKSVHRNYYES